MYVKRHKRLGPAYLEDPNRIKFLKRMVAALLSVHITYSATIRSGCQRNVKIT